jgi:hypothetical protein
MERKDKVMLHRRKTKQLWIVGIALFCGGVLIVAVFIGTVLGLVMLFPSPPTTEYTEMEQVQEEQSKPELEPEVKDVPDPKRPISPAPALTAEAYAASLATTFSDLPTEKGSMRFAVDQDLMTIAANYARIIHRDGPDTILYSKTGRREENWFRTARGDSLEALTDQVAKFRKRAAIKLPVVVPFAVSHRDSQKLTPEALAERFLDSRVVSQALYLLQDYPDPVVTWIAVGVSERNGETLYLLLISYHEAVRFYRPNG